MVKNDDIDLIRHSLAHLLATAVLEIYPDTKPTIGPTISNGFYYDFDLPAGAGAKEGFLELVEVRMREILKTWKTFEGKEVSAKKAKEFFKNNEYKLELIEDLEKEGQKITLYTSGEFTDLCRGGHVSEIKDIPKDSWKLEKIAGAYWRGDEKNKMLTRIYGLAFESKEKLLEYIALQEEAKKRDHKKLGKELDLFVFSELVGPGLPIYTPKGATVRREIVNYSNELQKAIGYREVYTPNINKAELFKVSGHYEKYKEGMFRVVSNYSKEEYYLKPMNCPHHTQIYASKGRSYRDLPIRIADFANLYRDEKPGELNGLTRLRAFSQDDGHSFCREDQIKEEFLSVLGIIKVAMETYGMKYNIELSLWDPKNPEKYLGEPDVWEKSQKLLEEILVENKIDYVKIEGEAAIYGPKMDLIAKDSLGRELQISTIQLDFIMPERFGLKYTDKDGSEKTPVMIHRAIVGSPERFMGILIEHYAGNFPLWLSPVQVKVIPVRENHNAYAQEVFDFLKENNIRAEVDLADENLGKKVRQAKNEKIPYWIVLGDKEVASKEVTVEARGDGEGKKLGSLSIEKFLERLQKEIKEKK
ncbi:MAG: threonine--tRNA ligase [Candidatus Zambryskibacteria bacterium RIFCSPLOWO2_12_FULL_39_16]|uniref:Threonine--tRNA ligase n=1 Tax=Candidatus Zambryskibacteria bacterium RIFCSPLOWO2_12_FULL_39_16 TaxID=1802775 RepID=A0A1G2UR35_9BACT|nr:MAG: threonine--tRNA ligase [Candidatus Zambryskibacteria bacterium RIFCSPLOWO2_12_FULL_39_16]